MQNRLMGTRMVFDLNLIVTIAESVALDGQPLVADIQTPEIEMALDKARAVVSVFGFYGNPVDCYRQHGISGSHSGSDRPADHSGRDGFATARLCLELTCQSVKSVSQALPQINNETVSHDLIDADQHKKLPKRYAQKSRHDGQRVADDRNPRRSSDQSPKRASQPCARPIAAALTGNQARS